MYSSACSCSSSSSDHHLSAVSAPVSTASEQLCYIHCNICDTVLAVSVPCTSLFKTVTVRCGHCANLLPVNMRLLFPSLNQFHNLGHNNLYSHQSQDITDEIQNANTNYMIGEANRTHSFTTSHCSRGVSEELPQSSHQAVNRPPEKRQRVPSAYNRFIKEEIQRIKAENPDITHREAFSAAAKNWAHFPHIQFGVMPGQTVNMSNMLQQEGQDPMVKDGFLASANVGISPY